MLCSRAVLAAAVSFVAVQFLLNNVTSQLQKCTECSSDADCQIYKDCCHNYDDSGLPTIPPPYPPFQCHSISLNANYQEYYWMVSECPPDWSDPEVESNCVRNTNDREFHSIPPVTDDNTGFVYRNEYCAACNGVSDLSVWEYDISCDPALLVAQMDSSFVLTPSVLAEYCSIERFSIPLVNRQPPLGNVEAQDCFPSISECLPLDQIDNNITQARYGNLQNACENDVIQQLVTESGDFSCLPYRNEDCAICNNANVFNSSCFELPIGPEDGIGPGIAPQPDGSIPFSATLDILGDGQIVVRSEVITINITVTCSQSEVYDPVAQGCRQTLLCDGVSIRTQCLNSTRECNGNLLNLTRSEDSFQYLNSSAILYNDEVYAIEFNTTEGDPVICVNFSRNGTEEANMTVNYYSYPQAFFILTYIGCSLSVIGTASVLITYTIFKELRTLPSKILMNLAVAILISNLLILLGGPIVGAFPDVVDLCVASGILLHFFFLAQFSWMSIMSLEMTRVFCQASQLKNVDSNRTKRVLLLFYLFVGWSVPLLITVIAIIVNYSKDGLVLYGVLPDGSRGSCWINHIESAAVAFVTPLAVSLIFNCITFTIVSILLCKASRSQAKLDKGGNISFFRVHIAVFSTSGLTWIFGFLAILTRTSWSWYPFIILNSLQGFIVFLAFLCTKRVANLYAEKIKLKKNLRRPITSSTKSSAIIMKGGLSPKTSFIGDSSDFEAKTTDFKSV